MVSKPDRSKLPLHLREHHPHDEVHLCDRNQTCFRSDMQVDYLCITRSQMRYREDWNYMNHSIYSGERLNVERQTVSQTRHH